MTLPTLCRSNFALYSPLRFPSGLSGGLRDGGAVGSTAAKPGGKETALGALASLARDGFGALVIITVDRLLR